MGLVFIGAGLGSFKNMSLEAIEAVKRCDSVYVDVYTSLWAPDFLEQLQAISPNCIIADRRLLEDGSHKILAEAKTKEVGIVIPGDPFIATTHAAVRTLAHRRQIPVKIIHGTSIVSSAISASGLHVYKFGKIVTVPKAEDLLQFMQVFKTVEENLSRGLHTLLLLDTADGGLTVANALKQLEKASSKLGVGWLPPKTLVIALARLGFPEFKITASTLEEISATLLPPPPHVIIIPSRLHFSEREVVNTYSESALEQSMAEINPVKDRVKRYVEKCRRILSIVANEPELADYADYVSNYVNDAERFLDSDDLVNSLLAVGYAEGLLDGLRMMRRVDFQW